MPSGHDARQSTQPSQSLNRESDDHFAEGRLTIIEPTRGWRSVDLEEIWAYRELLWVLTLRDIKVRYKQTVLGAAWAVLQPVTIMIVFSIIFGRLVGVPSDGLPYPIFVFAGLLPWQLFASALSQSGQSVVGSSHLVSKVYFPRLIVPISSIGAALVDFVIASVLLVAMMLWYDVGFTSNLLMAPVLLLILVLCALGVGTLLSALTVAYRDFRHVLPFLVQVWFFMTPVIYPRDIASEKWAWLFSLNPMAGVVEGFRSAFLGRDFDWLAMSISAGVAVAFFLVGVAYFERVERRFADVI